LWSGGVDKNARDEMGRVREQGTVARRLGMWRERVVAMGVRADMVQMAFCQMVEGEKGLCGMGTGSG